MPAIDQLKENSKIARATHNMVSILFFPFICAQNVKLQYSYVLNTEGIEQSDNFDDGEKGIFVECAAPRIRKRAICLQALALNWRI